MVLVACDVHQWQVQRLTSLLYSALPPRARNRGLQKTMSLISPGRRNWDGTVKENNCNLITSPFKGSPAICHVPIFTPIEADIPLPERCESPMVSPVAKKARSPPNANPANARMEGSKSRLGGLALRGRSKSKNSLKEEVLDVVKSMPSGYFRRAASFHAIPTTASFAPEQISFGKVTSNPESWVSNNHEFAPSGQVLPCERNLPPLITIHTMASLLRGDFNHKIARYTILDCRYSYEYEGGHIRDAIHADSNIKDVCHQLMHDEIKYDKDGRKLPHVLIFHCEFSKNRGPRMARMFREVDSRCTEGNYLFPELYVMKGGYREFYSVEQYRTLCDGGYTPMSSEDSPRCNNDNDEDRISNYSVCSSHMH